MDQDTLTNLVKAHQASLYRYLRYLGAGSVVAEDLVQETFLAAFRSTKAPGLAQPGQQAGWLRGVARNLLLAYLRRMRANPVVSDSDSLQQAEELWASEFLRDGDGLDYLGALRQCLGSLPEKQRQALDLQYTQKKSRAELAETFQMTEDGVKSLMQRIRARLADCVRQRLHLGDRT